MWRPAIAAAMAGLCALAALSRSAGISGRRLPADECVAVPATSINTLIEQQRFWHASRALPVLRGTRPLPAETAVVYATVAEGLERFAEVDALLRRARGGDSLPAFLLLAARADERNERWFEAATKYRKVLRLGDSESEGQSSRAASARLAFMFERQGLRDSAIAAWRRAAQYSPEIADWFALRRAALERDTAIAFASLSAPRTPGALQQGQLFVAGRLSALDQHEAALAIYLRYGRTLDAAREEFLLGRRATARARADTMLLREPAHPFKPDAVLATTFLSERFAPLTLPENLAASIAYRTRRDLRGAERFAREAVIQGKRSRPDTAIAGWLELARVQSERRDLLGALRSLDSAAVRAGRGSAAVGVARVRALVATDYLDKAEELLAQVASAHPGDTSVARVILEFSDRNRLRGERESEQVRYRLLLSRFAEAPAANGARYRTALAVYLAGNHDSALTIMDDAAARDTLHALGLGPRYWEARMRFERGEPEATAALRAIAGEQPVAFYGVRARELLGDTAFLSDSMPPLPRPGSFPPARARDRIHLLATLGFDLEARAEAVGWASDTSASVYVLMAAAAAAGDEGFARESILLGDSARRRVGMLPGVARAMFPLSYRSVIEAESAEHCVDPLLMAALIRQESRFDPHAVSRVGARGISQVMPATGKQMSDQSRMGPWDANLLFVPDFNLHLGSRYVSDRMSRDVFPTYALLASYNAGPARVRSWKNWPEYGDTDLFSERVSIAETRDYVRTVYASYVWYRYAWASPPAPSSAQPAPVP